MENKERRKGQQAGHLGIETISDDYNGSRAEDSIYINLEGGGVFFHIKTQI